MSDKQGIFIRIAAIVVIVIAFVAYLYVNRSVVLAPVSTVAGFVLKSGPITYDYNSQAGFYSGGNGYFYFYSRNRISYNDSAAETIWSEPHDMSSPLAYGAGEYLVLSETRGNSVRVYSTDGLMYFKHFDNPVVNFHINESGYCSVRLQYGSGYRTLVYSQDGTEIYMRMHGKANVFPMASAVSFNGRELAISLLDVNGVNIETHLMISHVLQSRSITDSEGVWHSNRKDGQIIASLKFNGNDDLLSVSDTEMTLYRITSDERSSESRVVKFTNYIGKLEYMGDNGVALALRRGIPGLDSAPENTVQVYDNALNLLNSYTVPRAISYLHGSRQGAIAGTGQTYYGFNAGGVLQWQYTATSELKQLIYLNGTDTILEAGLTEARILIRNSN